MDKNPANFFDKILTFLSSDYNRSFTIDEIVNDVYKEEIVQNSKSSSGLKGLTADTHYKSNVINAIMFLKSQGLVAYDEQKETAFINTKGFIKIKTEGFVKEIRNKKVNLWLQRGTWVASIIALSLSVYTIFFNSKNSCSATNVSNSDCKHQTKDAVLLQKDTIQLKRSLKNSLQE